MAGVDRVLSLKDGFSGTLQKYISMLDRSIKREDYLTTLKDAAAKAEERLIALQDQRASAIAQAENAAAAAQEKLMTVDMARIKAMEKMISEGNQGITQEKEWIKVTEEMSAKTLKAADSAETMIASLSKFKKAGATGTSIEGAVTRINQALLDEGYVWTEKLEGFNEASILMENNLDKLAKSGFIVKTSVNDVFEAQQNLQDSMGTLAPEIQAVQQQIDSYEQSIKALENPVSKVEQAMTWLADRYHEAKDALEEYKAAHAGEETLMDKLAGAFTRAKDALINWQLAHQKGSAAYSQAAAGVNKLAEGHEKASKATLKHGGFLDGLSKRVIRMGLYFFSAQKLISYFRQAAGRAPDAIQKKYDKLKETISNLFGGPVVAAMSKMSAGVDRLNQALASPAGQKFQRAMERIGSVVGSAVSFAFEKLAQLIEWIGNNIEVLAIAAIPILTLFAIKLFTVAAGAIAAHLPLLLLIGAAVTFAVMLNKLGLTAADVFGALGAGVYGLWAIVQNVGAGIGNVVLSLVETSINKLIDLGVNAKKIFYGIADYALAALEKIAGAYDKIFKTNHVATIQRWRNRLSEKAEALDGVERVKFDRFDYVNVLDKMQEGWKAGSAFGNSLSDKALSLANAQELKAINRNTSAIKDAVTDEDITALVDMAERQFVNNINLTSQTPIITVNGANTGNSEADRQAMARAIRDVLIEEIAAGPVAPSPAYYGIGG